MRKRVKYYIESCCDQIRLNIKLHKFFQGDGNFLEDAEIHIKNAETAIEFDKLPSELLKRFDENINESI